MLHGVVLGVLYINNANEAQSDEIRTYIENFMVKTKENTNIDYMRLLFDSIKQNLSLALLLWFAGLTVVGIIAVYVIIAYRGFCLGYSISSIVATLGTKSGIIFIFSSMLLHNLILIPSIFAISISCIKLYKSIMKDKRRDNIKLEILRHTFFCGIMCIALILASIIETYVSTNILMLVKNIL